MNRPTQESTRSDGDHGRDGSSSGNKDMSARHRWNDVLHHLQALSRSASPPPDATARPHPQPHPGPPNPVIGEALDALQLLARRYGGGSAPAPIAPADVEDDPFPRRPPGYSPPPPAFHPAADAPEAAPGAEWPDSGEVVQISTRPRWSSLALIVGSSAVLAVLLVGALSLSRQVFHESEPPAPSPRQTNSAGTVPPAETAITVPVRTPTTDGATVLPAIEKAMSECDIEAAKNQDALYFLILPVQSPIKNYQPWVSVSVGEIGTSVILLRSKDTLDGLRDGSLALYREPFTFSIIDSTTAAEQSWGPIVGISRLAKLDAAPIAGFRVRFGFADFVGDTPSNFRFPREKGVCYWVSALLRT
jgi:hypothetical protein